MMENFEQEMAISNIARANQCDDLTSSLINFNKGLKISLQRLSQEYDVQRAQKEKNAETISALQESDEKLQNKHETLQYNRSESFAMFTEMRNACDQLLAEQAITFTLVEGMVLRHEKVKSFVMSCKEQKDKISQSLEKRSLLYNFTLQDIKNQSLSKKSEKLVDVEKLEQLNEIVQDKLNNLKTTDYKDLDEKKEFLKNILAEINKLSCSLEEENHKKDVLKKYILEGRNNFNLSIKELNESNELLNKEVGGKELENKNLIEKKSQYHNKIEDVVRDLNSVKSNIDNITEQLTSDEKRKSIANEAVTKASVTLEDCTKKLETATALEVQLNQKHKEMESLKTKFNTLSTDVEETKKQLNSNILKLNQAHTEKAELEVVSANLKASYDCVSASIKSLDRELSEKLVLSEEIRNEIKTCEEKTLIKEHRLAEEVKSVQLAASSYRDNLGSLKEKMNEINEQIDGINKETSRNQNELNMMSCEMMVEEEMMLLMKEKDEEEFNEIIQKYEKFTNLIEMLNRAKSDLDETMDSISEALETLTNLHASELMDKKKNKEVEKSQLSSEIKLKKKELTAAHVESNRLCRSLEEINFCSTWLKNKRSLYNCLEAKLKAHSKWILKQFAMAQLRGKNTTAFNLPKVTNSASEPEKNSAFKNKGKEPAKVTNKVPSVQLKANIKDNKPSKVMKTAPQVFTPEVIELSSGSDSLSPIHPDDKVVIHKTEISQVSTPREPHPSPQNQVPFFTLFTHTNTDGSRFLTTESSSNDSHSAIDLKMGVPSSSSTPKQLSVVKRVVEPEKGLSVFRKPAEKLDIDSDNSFNNCLKRTNEVILKSKVMNKEREKQPKKTKLSSSIICLDSD